MSSRTHIPVETLADIADERATSEVRKAAMSHISACSTCLDMLHRIQQLILMMKSDNTIDAPRDVLASAINIFSREKPLPLRRIIALLTFDSYKAGPAFGVRSLRTASRQMLYSAEDIDLELRVTVQNDECILAGQIIGEGCAGADIEVAGEAGRSTASLNEMCEFTLQPIPAGNYSLTVRMLDREIEIPELELKV